MLNDMRRADAKFGAPGQLAIVFDGQGVTPSQHEAVISEGYVGKCPL